MTPDYLASSVFPVQPFDMPNAGPPHDTPERNPSTFTRRSSVSLTSDSSFSTARSTTPANQSPDVVPTRPATPVGPLHLGLPHNLRHSLSVDSFVRHGIPIGSTRTKRTNTDLAMRPPVLPHQGARDFDHRAFQPDEVTRHRGASLSTQGDYDSSFFEDTDYDAWHSASRRRSSLKGKDQQQPYIRPGELKLPPRMPALSTTSSISSMSTSPGTTSSMGISPITPVEEETRRLHSTTSMQHIPTTPSHPAIASLSGRARSGSLGVKASRPVNINTSLTVRPSCSAAVVFLSHIVKAPRRDHTPRHDSRYWGFEFWQINPHTQRRQTLWPFRP